jgi:hypothetical protein
MFSKSNDLLKATSRSFYLIPHCETRLSAAVRPQIGPAYRLAPHFHRPFRTNKFPCCHQGHRPWLISTVAPRPNIVPKAQPDISQTRSVWYRGKMKIRPEGTVETPRQIFAGQLRVCLQPI